MAFGKRTKEGELPLSTLKDYVVRTNLDEMYRSLEAKGGGAAFWIQNLLSLKLGDEYTVQDTRHTCIACEVIMRHCGGGGEEFHPQEVLPQASPLLSINRIERLPQG
jgi:hypothetical protein